jgi:hypothetical protein
VVVSNLKIAGQNLPECTEKLLRNGRRWGKMVFCSNNASCVVHVAALLTVGEKYSYCHNKFLTTVNS